MIQKKYVLAITFLMVLYFGVSPGLAVPAAPYTHILQGKDGSNFTAKLWGDEWSHGWETTDGYSIVFNETTKDWAYAIPNADGNLVSSKKVVGTDSPSIIIPKHLRPQGKAQKKILDLRASQAQTVSEKSVPATGTANIPVILINFNDRSTTYTPAAFNALLFGTGTKSMKDYYQEVSYGKFSISPGPSGVAGWYTASNSHDYYGFDYGGISGNDDWPGTLVRETVAKADPTVNFAPYDNDGDCYVDTVIIIHQGTGQEASGNTTDIWSHQWTLNDAYYAGYSNGGEYTTNDACPKGGFIKVDLYVIQPETMSGGQSTMGVFAHEFGHALGLPDLYDTTFASASKGVGDWSLMASGNWLGISRAGDRPAHLDAWSKSVLGWVSPTQVSTSSVTQIKRVEDNSVVYQLLDNPNGVTDWTRTGTGKGEYFLVENRQKTGFDAALPGEGLLIWHIDESIGNNDNYLHKLVDLEEADGLNNLDSGLNLGDAGDPWYNKVVGFTATSTPNSHLYNGSDSGVRVTNIGASGTIMEANLLVPGGSVAPVANFTADVSLGVAPLTVAFTDQSTGTPGTWNWTFGDGDTTNATKRNPVHTYITPGTYDVSLNVTYAGGVSNVTKKSGYIFVTKYPATKIGVFRNGYWYVDWNGNSTWDVVDAAHTKGPFGQFGDIAVAGDWNGNGTTKIGVFSNGYWYFDWNNNGILDTADALHNGYFGIAGDKPVVGNWTGDGISKIGVFRNGYWYVDWNGNSTWDTVDAVHIKGPFGLAGDSAVVGDWNGNGTTKIGVFRSGYWYIDWNGNGAWDTEDAQHIGIFGIAGDNPVIGDWNGDGISEFGVFRNGYWYVDWNNNGIWDAGDATHIKGPFGQAGDIPVAGKWS